MRPVRVLAVDHNRILRQGLCWIIEVQPDMELVGSADNEASALSLYSEKRPDLTLLDLDLPKRGGLSLLRQIRDLNPRAWVIAQITDEWDEPSRLAKSLGASSILAKERLGKSLLNLIRAGDPTRAHPRKAQNPDQLVRI